MILKIYSDSSRNTKIVEQTLSYGNGTYRLNKILNQAISETESKVPVTESLIDYAYSQFLSYGKVINFISCYLPSSYSISPSVVLGSDVSPGAAVGLDASTYRWKYKIGSEEDYAVYNENITISSSSDVLELFPASSS